MADTTKVVAFGTVIVLESRKGGVIGVFETPDAAQMYKREMNLLQPGCEAADAREIPKAIYRLR